MVKVSTPSLFKCPISAKLMRDPVTLCTGQTYDRQSISEWFAKGHTTCPATMQALKTCDMVPNSLLQKMIEQWRAANNSRSGLLSATDGKLKPAIIAPWKAEHTAASVGRVLDNLGKSGNLKQKEPTKVMANLRMIAKESQASRALLVDAGAVEILCNFLFKSDNLCVNEEACEEALAVLILLPLYRIRGQIAIQPKKISVIAWLLCRGSVNARVNAALLLARLVDATDENNSGNAGAGFGDVMKLTVGATPGVFEGLVELIKDESHPRPLEAGLKAALSLMESERSVSKGVRAGLAFAVVESLGRAKGSNLLRALTLLERICSHAEGLTVVSAHALAIPVLARVVRVQVLNAVKEKAISSLWVLCSQSGSSGQICIDEATAQEGLLSQLLQFTAAALRNYDGRYGSCQRATYLKALLLYRSKNCPES